MSGMTYAPASLLEVIRSRLVAVLCSTTAAPGTIPPEASYTVPLIAELAWPRAVPGSEAQTTNNSRSPTPWDHRFRAVPKQRNVIVAAPLKPIEQGASVRVNRPSMLFGAAYLAGTPPRRR